MQSKKFMNISEQGNEEIPKDQNEHDISNEDTPAKFKTKTDNSLQIPQNINASNNITPSHLYKDKDNFSHGYEQTQKDLLYHYSNIIPSDIFDESGTHKDSQSIQLDIFNSPLPNRYSIELSGISIQNNLKTHQKNIPQPIVEEPKPQDPLNIDGLHKDETFIPHGLTILQHMTPTAPKHNDFKRADNMDKTSGPNFRKNLPPCRLKTHRKSKKIIEGFSGLDFSGTVIITFNTQKEAGLVYNEWHNNNFKKFIHVLIRLKFQKIFPCLKK